MYNCIGGNRQDDGTGVHLRHLFRVKDGMTSGTVISCEVRHRHRVGGCTQRVRRQEMDANFRTGEQRGGLRSMHTGEGGKKWGQTCACLDLHILSVPVKLSLSLSLSFTAFESCRRQLSSQRIPGSNHIHIYIAAAIPYGSAAPKNSFAGGTTTPRPILTWGLTFDKRAWQVGISCS